MSLLTTITSRLREQRKTNHFPFSGIGTLLLSDIGAFSAGSSEIFPRDLAAAINRVIGLQVRSLHESNGLVLSVGELSLAVWGPSFSIPSHAAMAFRAGRNILADLRKVDKEMAISFQLRIALTTGKMTADFIGGRAQVVGAPFTTAKRLLELEIPRRTHLLCTSETLEHVSDPPPSDPITKIRGCSAKEVAVFEFTS